MNTDQILYARNRTRIPHKVYLYEAEINMLRAYGSISDTAHAIIAAFLRQTKHDMSFLKERDVNKIKDIHRAVTYNV